MKQNLTLFIGTQEQKQLLMNVILYQTISSIKKSSGKGSG